MIAISKETPCPGAEIIDAPTPKIKPTEVLAKVKVASICGTDKHIYIWDEWASKRIKPPMIFGHEFGGEVVEIGSEVKNIKIGDHISAETHIPCGHCYLCKSNNMHICQNLSIIGVDQDGCFAEYVALPEICCIKNDKEIPWDIASIQEPLGNSVHCLSEANIKGKSVAILGDGPTGIFAAASAKYFGAKKVFAVGMQESRLNLIRKFDVDEVINVLKMDSVDYVLQKTNGEGVDVVLEMSGAERAIHNGFKMIKKAGTFVAFGIPSKPVNINFAEELIFNAIKVISINGRRMFETWHQVADLIASKKVNLAPVITHRFKLTDFNDAMNLLTADDIKAGKIVLEV